jgi:hypothetical protein
LPLFKAEIAKHAVTPLNEHSIIESRPKISQRFGKLTVQWPRGAESQRIFARPSRRVARKFIKEYMT